MSEDTPADDGEEPANEDTTPTGDGDVPAGGTHERRPLDSPGGHWWDEHVNRREALWLGLSGTWAAILFGWMLGWTQIGEQNQIGPTREVTPERFRRTVQEYKTAAGEIDVGEESALVPAGTDVYVGALQWAWDGLPVVLEAGEEYTFHLSTYDVQHGFSVRHEDNLSKQLSLQMLPDYVWELDMSFDDTGTYHVVCNEFCGVGHRSMHGTFYVQEDVPDAADVGGGESGGDESPGDYGGWFTGDARGAATDNYDSPVDATGEDAVTVTVGAEGNGGTYAYDPAAVQVTPGTTVTYEWASNNHNLAVDTVPDGADWSGHDAVENEGYSVEHTFETTGTYRYYCDPHLAMGMKGVVEVV
jgi:halocyanin-like protein